MAQTPDLQIEIIHPNGRRETRILAGAKKIANIGSHPANEIVLSGAGIAEFHAILDYRQTPYKYLLLNGNQSVVEESLHQSDRRLVIGGYSIVLLQFPQMQNNPEVNEPLLSNPTPVTQNNRDQFSNIELGRILDKKPQIGTPVNSSTIRIIAPDPNKRSISSLAELAFTIMNTGTLTAEFDIEFRKQKDSGEWLPISISDEDIICIINPEDKHFNLNNEERKTVVCRIDPNSGNRIKAGWYLIRIVVKSRTYSKSADSYAELAIRIQEDGVINLGEPTPSHLQLHFAGRQNNELSLPIISKSNQSQIVNINGKETKERCLIEFYESRENEIVGLGQHPMLSIPDQTRQYVSSRIVPRHRHWFGLRRKYEVRYIIERTNAKDEKVTSQSDIVTVVHKPLISWLWIPILLMATSLVALYVGSVKVVSFNFDKPHALGEDATLSWSTSGWSKPVQLEKIGITSSITIPILINELSQQNKNVIVDRDPDYRLTVKSKLLPQSLQKWIPKFFQDWIRVSDSLELSIKRSNDEGIISLNVNPLEVPLGSSVLLEWYGPKYINEFRLLADDSEIFSAGVISPTQAYSYTHIPQHNITYTLIASSGSVTGELTTTRTITVIQFPPNIIDFQVTPVAIAPGTNVSLTWRIEKRDGTHITLDGEPIQQFSNEITATVSPSLRIGMTQTITLRAEYSGTQPSVPGVATKQVVIYMVTPTPITPVPKPVITFVAEPIEVVQGKEVNISWSVKGADELSISQGIIPTPMVLEERTAKGTAVVEMKTPGPQRFTLKAKAIGTASTAIATREIQINVLEPTGTPTPTPIPAAQGALRLEGAGKVTIVGTNRYQVPINTFANVVWEITNNGANTPKIEIRNQAGQVLIGGGDKGTVEVRVNRNSQYQLWGTNDPNQALVQIATIDVEVQVPATPQPLVNVNLVFTDSVGLQTPVRVTWFLPAESIDLVAGFRIYRSDSGSNPPNLVLLADEATLDKTKTEWTDTSFPTCGKTYYVAVAYDTYTEDGDKVRSQTDASRYSIASPICPQ